MAAGRYWIASNHGTSDLPLWCHCGAPMRPRMRRRLRHNMMRSARGLLLGGSGKDRHRKYGKDQHGWASAIHGIAPITSASTLPNSSLTQRPAGTGCDSLPRDLQRGILGGSCPGLVRKLYCRLQDFESGSHTRSLEPCAKVPASTLRPICVRHWYEEPPSLMRSDFH